MNPRSQPKIQSLAHFGKSTRTTNSQINQRKADKPLGKEGPGISKQGQFFDRDGPLASENLANLGRKEEKEEEGNSEFMAKLSELTGKLSNMDYVPKNKLLKKEFERSEKMDSLPKREVLLETKKDFGPGDLDKAPKQSYKGNAQHKTKSQSVQHIPKKINPASKNNPPTKVSKELQKDIADDQELRNFMKKYDTWEEEDGAGEIFSAAD